MSITTDAKLLTTGFGSVPVVWRTVTTRGLLNVRSGVVLDGGGQPVRHTERTLLVATEDVPDAAAVDDTVTIDGTAYKAREWFPDDGDGLVTQVVVAK